MSLDVGTLNAYLKLDSTQFTAALLTAQAKTQEFFGEYSCIRVKSYRVRIKTDVRHNGPAYYNGRSCGQDCGEF